MREQRLKRWEGLYRLMDIWDLNSDLLTRFLALTTHYQHLMDNYCDASE